MPPLFYRCYLMEDKITLAAILKAAGAFHFTQYGIDEAKNYSHFKLSDAKFVAACLDVIARANNNPVFLYERRIMSKCSPWVVKKGQRYSS